MTINKLIFTGHVGKDAFTRTTGSGKTIVNFTAPCTSGYGDHKKTTWITCKILGKYGEKMLPHIKKGTPVTVIGEFSLDEWTNDNGEQKLPVVIVESVVLGKSSDAPQQAAPQAQAHGYQQQQAPAQQAPQGQAPPQAPEHGFDDFNDALPF